MHSDSNLKSADAPLVDYRLYALNERNRIFGSARHISAIDDRTAIEMTPQFPDGRAIELWQADRLVFRLTPNESNPISPVRRACASDPVTLQAMSDRRPARGADTRSAETAPTENAEPQKRQEPASA
jgi:hypothetical protein